MTTANGPVLYTQEGAIARMAKVFVSEEQRWAIVGNVASKKGKA